MAFLEHHQIQSYIADTTHHFYHNLSTSDEERAKSKEAYGEAKLKLRENELTLKEKQFSTDAVSDLVNSLLFSTLKSKRIDIPIAHERDKFDWDAIADYCASTKYFDSEVIENLRSLETGVGFDTSGLTGTRPSELAGRISELKDSIKNFYVSKERVDDFEDSGIDSASISSAAKKSEEIQEKVHLFDKTKGDIAIEREELDSNKLQHKDFDNRYQAALEAGSEAEKINKKIRIARAIHTAIQETDEEYKNETFREMLTSVSSFWQKIDQDGKYIPELSKGTINLKRKADGALFPITVDQDTGEASGGESQLLLVCICLALAEKSGAKMPIILDDCFTDVDKPTRRELVKTVCESFDSMIFVTNDEDKASLMQGHSDGTLELRQWGADRISVDDEEWDEWRVWK